MSVIRRRRRRGAGRAGGRRRRRARAPRRRRRRRRRFPAAPAPARPAIGPRRIPDAVVAPPALAATATIAAAAATATAAAPARATWETKSCASNFSPASAMNRSPGPTSRLSKARPVPAKSPLACPPVASASSAAVQSALMLHTPAKRRHHQRAKYGRPQFAPVHAPYQPAEQCRLARLPKWRRQSPRAVRQYPARPAQRPIWPREWWRGLPSADYHR